MPDLAELEIRIKSEDASQAAAALNQVEQSAKRLEAQEERLFDELVKLEQQNRKVTQSYIGLADKQAKAAADADKMTASERRALREMKEFGQTNKDAEQFVKSFGVSLTQLAGTFGALAIIRSLITNIVQIDKAMADLRVTVISTTDSLQEQTEQIAALDKAATEMGANSTQGFTKAAQGLNQLIRAGLSTQEAVLALPSAIDLATARSLDLGQTAEAVGRIMQQFGLDIREVAHVADLLAAADQPLEFAQSLRTIAAQSRGTKTGLEELAAILAILDDRGIEASRGTQQLLQIFENFRSPNEALIENLRRLGLTTDDINPVLHSTAEIFKTLAERGLDAANVDKLFGVRSTETAAVLLREAEAVQTQTKALEENTGAAKRAAEAHAGLGDATSRLGAKWEAFAKQVSESGGSFIARGTIDALSTALETATHPFDTLLNTAKNFNDLFVGAQAIEFFQRMQDEADRTRIAADQAQKSLSKLALVKPAPPGFLKALQEQQPVQGPEPFIGPLQSPRIAFEAPVPDIGTPTEEQAKKLKLLTEVQFSAEKAVRLMTEAMHAERDEIGLLTRERTTANEALKIEQTLASAGIADAKERAQQYKAEATAIRDQAEAQKFALETRNAMAVGNAIVAKETELLKLNTQERALAIKMMEFEEQARQRGIKLTAEQIKAHEEELRSQQAAEAAFTFADLIRSNADALEIEQKALSADKDERQALIETLIAEQAARRAGHELTQQEIDDLHNVLLARQRAAQSSSIADTFIENSRAIQRETEAYQGNFSQLERRLQVAEDTYQLEKTSLADRQRIAAAIGAESASVEDLTAQLAAMNEELARQKEIRRVAEELASTFTSAFSDILTGAKSFSEGMQAIFEDLSRQILEESLKKALVEGFQALLAGSAGGAAGGAGGDMSGLSGILSGLFSGAGAAAKGRVLMPGELPRFAPFRLGGILAPDNNVQAYRQGEAFEQGRRVVPFLQGGQVFNQPTFFPMAGGETGKLGEAGPEAILPLKRGPTGELGIESQDGGGGGETHVTYNQTYNIYTQDADSFRRSKRQILSEGQTAFSAVR